MTEPYSAPVVLGRGPAAGGGELVLRRRPAAGPDDADVVELIVDGVFAMDSVQVSTERRLASETLARLAQRATASAPSDQAGWRVLVGGLGLGYTTRELLADPRVGRVEIVELEPALVEWVRSGLVRPAAGLLDDPRVSVVVGDVVPHLAAARSASYDAILLDVDNGPDFLVHQSNSALYADATLTCAVGALVPGGRVAVWSADASPDLERRLRAAARDVEALTLTVAREGRTFDYVLYLASA